MRLVIDARRLTTTRTGVGRYLEALLQEWSGAGSWPCADRRIVLQDPAGLDRVPPEDRRDAEVIGTGWPGLAWEVFGLGRILRPGDLLFAPANLIPPTWRGPTVLVLHDVIQEVLPEGFPWHVRWRFGLRYRQAAWRADRVIVPSEATAQDVARIYGVGLDRIRVIHQAPDPSFRPQPAGSDLGREARAAVGLEDAPFFLFVGKRSRRRNIPAILEAFARHRHRYPSDRLVFVGPPGPEERDEQFGPGVVRAGHVAEPVLHGLLTEAIALLYPSEYEGFGLPIVEAMASGCPVLTLKNSALVEAGAEAAWYLPSADPVVIAEAMQSLTTDPDLRARWSGLGIARASRLSRNRFAAEVRSELIGVLNENEPRSTRESRPKPAEAVSVTRSESSTGRGRESPGR